MARVRYTDTVNTMLDSALATSTRATYTRVQEQLATFLHRPAGAPILPVSVGELCEFLGTRFEDGCNASTLATAASAIAYGHRMAGLPDPTVAFHVKQLLAGARRLRPGRDKRLALTIEDIKRLCAALRVLPISPIDRRAFRAIFTLAFFAMMRPGEMVIGTYKSCPYTTSQACRAETWPADCHYSVIKDLKCTIYYATRRSARHRYMSSGRYARVSRGAWFRGAGSAAFHQWSASASDLQRSHRYPPKIRSPDRIR